MAGITPPGTLSVVPGYLNETRPTSLASLDWRSSSFFDRESSIAQPSSEVLRVASLAAQSMAVIPPAPPAVNSSYRVQFYGPTVQCSLANSSQQALFDAYSEALANSSQMQVTASQYESGKLKWGDGGRPGSIQPLMSVYSAFSPHAGKSGWLSGRTDGYDYSIDQFNNWITVLLENFTEEYQLSNWAPPDNWFVNQQLWIQTADQGMVCTMENASFDVQYQFENGVQTVAAYSTLGFEPFWVPSDGTSTTLSMIIPANLSLSWTKEDWNPFNSYMAMYLAFSGLLNGNVSTTLTDSFSNLDSASSTFDGNVTIYDGSSKVLQHGLSACADFVHGYVSCLVSYSQTFGIALIYVFVYICATPISCRYIQRFSELTLRCSSGRGTTQLALGKMDPYHGSRRLLCCLEKLVTLLQTRLAAAQSVVGISATRNSRRYPTNSLPSQIGCVAIARC